MSQIPLSLQLHDHAVFESFLPAGNEPVIAFLEEVVAEGAGPGAWIWGPGATGKTHLLQAVCARAAGDSQFVPLGELEAAGTAVIEGLASRRFVCIDDLDTVAGDAGWEAALFGLCNALVDAGGMLICSAAAAPRESGFTLPDLVSRLARLPAFRLAPMTDAERIQALQLRARQRGLELPDEAASFLLLRERRDMASLYALLDRLDAESLKAKRRLTVPFVKKVLRFSRAG